MKYQLAQLLVLFTYLLSVYCKDYYHILGVQKGDDTRAIKKAFRKLALKYHPGLLLNWHHQANEVSYY